MLIPIYEPPKDDEHIYSWILRLADMNGISVKKCIRSFFPDKRWRSGVDTLENLEENNFIDAEILLRKNTISYAIFPFLQSEKQAWVVERFLHGGDLHFCQTVSSLRFCPKCIEQDIEEGNTPYYHVWHQLDLVKVCAVHGCDLYEVPLSKLSTLTNETIQSGILLQGGSVNIAKMIYRMYYTPVYTNLNQWKDQLPSIRKQSRNRSKVIESGVKCTIPSNPDHRYIKKMRCHKCGTFFRSHPLYQKMGGLCPGCRETYSKEGLIQMYLDSRGDYELRDGKIYHRKCGYGIPGTPNAFIWSERKCPCEYTPVLNDYKEQMEDEEFIVEDFKIGARNARKFKIRHKKCGQSFWCIKSCFQKSHFCRCCNTPQNIFRNQVKEMTGDEYEVVQDGTMAKDYFLMRHNVCGTEFPIVKQSFINGSRCPYCKAQYGPKLTIDLLNEYCDTTGYSFRAEKKGQLFVEFPDGTSRRMNCYAAIQDLTRLDEPKYFIRKKRMAPIYGQKTQVFLFVKQRCEKNGEYRSKNKDAEILSMAPETFCSKLKILCDEGKLIKKKKQCYILPQNNDTPSNLEDSKFNDRG